MFDINNESNLSRSMAKWAALSGGALLGGAAYLYFRHRFGDHTPTIVGACILGLLLGYVGSLFSRAFSFLLVVATVLFYASWFFRSSKAEEQEMADIVQRASEEQERRKNRTPEEAKLEEEEGKVARRVLQRIAHPAEEQARRDALTQAQRDAEDKAEQRWKEKQGHENK
jgi:biopolymer transport protein ExbB/TolQ